MEIATGIPFMRKNPVIMPANPSMDPTERSRPLLIRTKVEPRDTMSKNEIVLKTSIIFIRFIKTGFIIAVTTQSRTNGMKMPISLDLSIELINLGINDLRSWLASVNIDASL
jgi:hypothetical protein